MLTMDALIGNLQTLELNRANNAAKKDQSLALKVIQVEKSKQDEDQITYLTRRFKKKLRKHGSFKKKENSSRIITANDLCHKCKKSGHFIKNFPMFTTEYKYF